MNGLWLNYADMFCSNASLVALSRSSSSDTNKGTLEYHCVCAVHTEVDPKLDKKVLETNTLLFIEFHALYGGLYSRRKISLRV